MRLICPRKNVRSATMMKFNPPAKSVNLSSWKIAATRKNTSWITSIVIAEMAKWSVSRIFTAIFTFFSFFRLVHSRAPFYLWMLYLKSGFSAAVNSVETVFRIDHRSMFTFTRFPHAQPVHLICFLQINNVSTLGAVFSHGFHSRFCFLYSIPTAIR